MGTVFIHVTMSLDGLIARPNDTIDWAFHYGTDHMVPEVMEEIGAVVLGNRGFKEGTMNEMIFPRFGGSPSSPGLDELINTFSLFHRPLSERVKVSRTFC